MKRLTQSPILLFLMLLLGTWAQAQVFIVNDLNSSSLPAGWVSVGGHSGSTTTPCEGSHSVRTNRYSYSPSGTLTTAAGVSNGNDITFSFSYKVINYSGAGATSGNWGSVALQYAVDGGAFTTFYTIGEGNHVPSTSCAVVTETISGASVPEGSSVQFRWASTWATGDWYLYIDQVNIASEVACPQPLALSASGVTTNAADLSWTPGGSEESWEVEFGASGFVQGTGTTVSAESNPYTLSGLSSNTTYSYYVRANCGGEYSGWTGPFSFTTACDVVSTFSEDFDSYATGSIAPSCWARLVSGTGSLSISSTSPASGTRNIYQYSFGTANGTIMVMPEVDNIHLGTHRLRFKARVGSGTGALNVGYLTDRTNAATFVTVQALSITNTSYGAETFVSFPNTVPAGAHLAIQNPGTSSASHYWDDVFWEAIPSCLNPAALTATNITNSSADLGWTPGGSEEAWEIEWGASGFAQGTGTTVSVGSNPYTLNGLSGNTTYSYYVRADCGEGDYSPWVGPFSFTTACDVVSTFSEDFDSYTTGSIVPNCWARLISGTGSQTITSTTPASGTRNIYQYSSSTANSTIVVMPEVDNIHLGTHRLRFKARVSSGTGALNVGYVTDRTNAATFVTVQALSITNTSYGVETLVNFPDTVPAGAHLAIQNPGTSTASHYWDDVNWEAIPTCPWPIAASGAASGFSSASLTWTAGGSEELWDIEWGADGFAQGTGTTVTDVDTTTYDLSGLTLGNSYDFYVRANCGGGDYSTWVGPYSFSVNYCTPAPSSVDGSGITNVTMDTINNTTGAEPGRYGDYSAMIANAQQATELPISITLATGYTYNMWAWVDWNNDLSFTGANEVYYLGEASATNPTVFTASILVPLEASLGLHRIRIGGADNGLGTTPPSNPCYTGAYGTFEDYTLNVTPAPSCLPPVQLTASSISHNSAALGWTNIGAAPAFRIQWGPTGFALGSGTQVVASGNPHTLSGLSPVTTYDFYVRANCGSGNFSTWVGPFTFTTGCAPVSDFSENFDSYATGSIAPACWSRLVSGNGTLSISSTSPASGTRNIYQYSFGTANSTIMVMAPVDNIHLGTHRLRFKARVGSGTGALNVGYVTDRTNAATFVTVQALTITNTSYGAETIVNFPATVPAGAHLAIQNPGTSSVLHYWDDVNWEAIPSCPDPTALTVTGLSSNSANLAWTPGYAETAWDIEWGPAGFAQGSGTVVAASSNAYTLSGLDAETSYSYYVRANCGEEDLSNWVGPHTFYTGYCLITSTNSASYINNFSTTGGLLNISNLASGYATGGYQDATSQVVSQFAGSAINFSAGFVGTTVGYNIWVDWNNDLDFSDAGERVYASGSYVSSASGSFTVPEGTAPGNYRMRMRCDYNATNPNACGSSGLGRNEAEDYTLTVVGPCSDPSDLFAMSEDGISAELSWTAGGDESAWDIEWGLAGFVQGTGTMAAVASNPYTIEGLTGYSDYEFYVRANCGSGANSAWAGPYAFSTPCAPPQEAPLIVMQSPTSVYVDWEDVPNAQTYPFLWRKVGPNVPFTRVNVQRSASMLTDLESGKLHAIRLRSKCGPSPADMSVLSATYNFTTPTDTGTCGMPTIAVIDSAAANRVRVYWNYIPGATQYRTQFRQLGEDVWQSRTSTAANVFINGIVPGIVYEYRVNATCPAGITGYSEIFTYTLNGTAVSSRPLADILDEEAIANDISLYPNPTSGLLYIELGAGAKYEQLQLFNVAGQRILAQDLAQDSERSELDMSGLPDGLYLIQLMGTSDSALMKVMLQR